MRRGVACLALALFIGTTARAGPADVETGMSSVNLAGEQRMLSQRIAKSYSQLGLNVLPTVAGAQMTAAIGRFEANLEELRTRTAGSPAAAEALERMGVEWLGLREAASAAVSRESALAVSRQAEPVLVSGEWLARILEDERESPADGLVRLAGRQRMLSQRIAKDYMLLSWGVEASGLREDMESSVRVFSGGLAILRAQADNSDEIRRELEQIARQWKRLKAALSARDTVPNRRIVAEAADSILEASDRITRLYEQHGRR